MGFPRLIPFVTLIGNGAFKTRRFTQPKYVGDPANTVALFSSFEAEELCVLDISDSFSQDRASDQTLSQIIENASMPIAFGGGIRKYADAKKFFALGFDKVIIRSGLADLNLVAEISHNFGAQAVAGCLDYNWSESNPDEIVINNATYSIQSIPIFLKELQESGLGEIVIQNIQADGERTGLVSNPLLESAVKSLDIPVVALGGCKGVEDAADFIKLTGCHSVAASATFLFRPTREAVLVNYPRIESWHERFEDS
jgi:cyclase